MQAFPSGRGWLSASPRVTKVKKMEQPDPMHKLDQVLVKQVHGKLLKLQSLDVGKTPSLRRAFKVQVTAQATGQVTPTIRSLNETIA